MLMLNVGVSFRWYNTGYDYLPLLWWSGGIRALPAVPLCGQSATPSRVVLRSRRADVPKGRRVLRRGHRDKVFRCLHQVRPCHVARTIRS